MKDIYYRSWLSFPVELVISEKTETEQTAQNSNQNNGLAHFFN